MSESFQLWAGATLIVLGIVGMFMFLLMRRLARPTKPKVPADAYPFGGFSEVEERPSLLDRMRGRVADSTSSRIESNRSGRRLSRTLERAGSKLRPGEWLLLVAAGATMFCALAWSLRGPLAGVLGAFLVVMGARFDLNRRLGKRQKAFADQLPDVLQMLSTSLRSGQSLTQAVQSVGAEAPSPTKEELKRVMIEQRIGRDLTASFSDLGDRMDSKDFEWIVSAIDINRSVGGDLSIILSRVEKTIRARNRVRGQVQAMSAEGKMSGIVLIALPPGVLFATQMLNPGYIDPMLGTGVGQLLLVLSVLMLAVGAFWLSRLARFVY